MGSKFRPTPWAMALLSHLGRPITPALRKTQGEVRPTINYLALSEESTRVIEALGPRKSPESGGEGEIRTHESRKGAVF